MLGPDQDDIDNEALDVMLGNLTQETIDSEGVWEQIGANWATQRTLKAEAEDELF